MIYLEGKKIFITGAGNGNGRAIAEGLAALGADLFLADRDLTGLKETKQLIDVHGSTSRLYELDITDRKACFETAENVIREHGDIDILINNAGVLRRSRFDDESAFDDLDFTMSVNVNGTYNVTKAFLESLKKSKGNILNVASIQSFVAAKTAHSYAISKGAVAQFTRTLAADLADFGIRVNAIAPGIIETNMSEATRSNEESFQSFLKHVPMARSALPEELLAPVAFLVSDSASYITGVILPVDGGYLTI